MSVIAPLNAEQQAFLEPYLPPSHYRAGDDELAVNNSSTRPFVTLTYACSLDGFISISPGVRTALSGPETKSMTHYLRLHHDAILVGVGTAIADNPSLNCRYPGTTFETQPIPVIVDPSIRWSIEGTAVTRLAQEGKGKIPLIVRRAATTIPAADALVETLSIEASEDGSLDWHKILLALHLNGIRSIMIEGGATILNTLLLKPELVDAVIVTIAPTWLGRGGTHVSPAPLQVQGVRQNSATLLDTTWKQFGADAVLCGKL